MGRLAALFAFIMIPAAQAALKKVPVDFAEVAVDSSRASLYIEGYLPNSCYGEPRVEVKREAKELVVDAVSDVKGEVCAEIVSYVELVVDLGAFQEGDYALYLQEGSVWRSTILFKVGGSPQP